MRWAEARWLFADAWTITRRDLAHWGGRAARGAGGGGVRWAESRWLFAGAWTITRRDLAHWARQPGLVAVGWLFPVMVVLMFGTLFGGAISTPGGDYYDYLMPGMFAMTMLFGLESTMTAVTTDAARGVTDRFRSLPMHSSAVVLGRCLADLLSSALGAAAARAAGLGA